MPTLKSIYRYVLFSLATLSFLLTAPANAEPDCSALQASPIFQAVKSYNKTNLLTASEKEITNAVKYGFTDNRGTAFYAALSSAKGLVAVHRLYNAKNDDFLWTISQREVTSATQHYGYVYNNINFFVSPTASPCTQPVRRFLQKNIHHYATNTEEWDELRASGWQDEGIVFYAGKLLTETESFPALGVNVEFPKDWSSEWYFTDLMKTARPFASVSQPWTGLETPIPVDMNGWPTGDAGVLVMAVNNHRLEVPPHIGGTYKLSFQGKATADMSVKANDKLLNVSYEPKTQRYIADVNYVNNNNLFFTFEGIEGGAKDIRLIRPGDNAADTFNSLFLQRLRGADDMFAIIRFMGAATTNGSVVREWADRTPKNYATQQKKVNGRYSGMAWEYTIELSNLAEKDPWINIPHHASDDYIRQLAVLFKNNLNSNRKIYVEYSNEIWNAMDHPDFTQRKEVSKTACDKVLAGDPDNYYWGLTGSKTSCRTFNNNIEYAFLGRHTAWRLKRISDIFREVFGDDAMITRIRPILAWDHWAITKSIPGTSVEKAGTLTDQLTYLNSKYGSPSEYIYGVAIGAYVSMLSKSGDASSNPYDLVLSVDQIFERMTEYNQELLPKRFTLLNDLVKQYDIKMLAYEGGAGLYGKINFDNMLKAHTDPRMKEVIKTLLQNWKNAGGDIFVYYNLVSSYADSGFWGLSERLDEPYKDTVKWQAIEETAAEWR